MGRDVEVEIQWFFAEQSLDVVAGNADVEIHEGLLQVVGTEGPGESWAVIHSLLEALPGGEVGGGIGDGPQS